LGYPLPLLRGGDELKPEANENEARLPELTVLSARDLS